ncbi:MAG: glycosyltransferase family 4 protein [bacterium]|nr:glycosyltransferase family 4 protein [bacterium]
MNALRLLYGVNDHKLTTIYNGIDHQFWNIDKVDKKTISMMKKEYNWENKYIGLYYGHSGKSKGLDYLIQAIPDIIKQHKDMQLVFNLIPAQRDQVCKRAIQQQVQKLPKEEQNKVKVLDGMLLEKLRTLVACSNLVIAPSLAE